MRGQYHGAEKVASQGKTITLEAPPPYFSGAKDAEGAGGRWG